MTGQEKFQKLVDKYNKTDAQEIHDTVDMLCSKGIGNGCFQNYAMLADVLEVLVAFERAVSEKEN